MSDIENKFRPASTGRRLISSPIRTEGDRLEFVKANGKKGDVDDGILSETLLTLSQAARRLPNVRGSKPLSPATLFRWINVGLKSRSGEVVRLEAWLIGGTRCTSVEALERFFQRLDDVAPAKPLMSQQSRKIKKQGEEAMEILRSRGVIGSEE